MCKLMGCVLKIDLCAMHHVQIYGACTALTILLQTKRDCTVNSKRIGLFNMFIIQSYLLNQQPIILYVDEICSCSLLRCNRPMPLLVPMQSQVYDGVFQPVIEKWFIIKGMLSSHVYE